MEPIKIFNGDNWPVVFVKSDFHEAHNQPSIAMCLAEILDEAEELFGKRDSRFTFLGVDFLCHGGPEFYWDNFYALIRLSNSAFLDIVEVRAQCAHECVHLLSPTKKTEATFLEEGVATFFQKKILDRYQRGMPCLRAKYRIALENTEVLLAIDEYAIKNLRRSEPNISRISTDLICNRYPSLDISVADKLVEKFYIDEKEELPGHV